MKNVEGRVVCEREVPCPFHLPNFVLFKPIPREPHMSKFLEPEPEPEPFSFGFQFHLVEFNIALQRAHDKV